MLNLFCDKIFRLKKAALLVILLGTVVAAQAQKEHNILLGIETGILPLANDSENLELFLNVEPKIKIAMNTFLGLRISLVINSFAFEYNDVDQYYIDEQFDNGIVSFLPTVDYYLNDKRRQPYVGLGLGIHVLPNPLEVLTNSSATLLDGNVNDRVGVLLRGGCEFGKLRVGLEYNFIPKGEIKIPSGEIIGTVDNSYLGVSIGCIFGVGKKAQ